MTKLKSIKTFAFVIAFSFLLLLPLLAGRYLPLLAAEISTTQPTKLPASANDLAKQVIAAYGGIDALKQAQASPYHTQAKVTVSSAISAANNSFACDIYGKGDQVRIETVVIGQKTIMGYDGTTCWTQTGDWVEPSTETIAKEIGEEIRHSLNQLVALADANTKLSLAGTKVIQGRACTVLKAVALDGKPTTFYIDGQNHLVLRSEYMGMDREQNVPAMQATDYKDYRPLGGTLIPYRSIDYSGGNKVSDTIVDKMEMGIALSDTVFAMPPVSEVPEVKDTPAVIPFDYVANKIVVKMRLNRNQTYNFIIDTGASETVLDQSVAQKLGPVTSSEFAITTGAKAVNLSYTTLPTVTIGSITLDNITALVTDLSAVQAQTGEPIAGLLGANILKRFLLTFDFQNKSLILANPKKVTVPSGAVVLKTSPIFGATALVVSGKIDNKQSVNFLVDTGASFNNLPASAAKALLSQPLLSVGQISGLDSQKLHIASCRFHSLNLGNAVIADPIFAISPDSGGTAQGLFTAGSLGILGVPVWSRFTVTIDYPGERLLLSPVPAKEEMETCLNESRQIDLRLRQTKHIDQAISAYQSMSGKHKDSFACQAVAYSGLGNCYEEKYQASKDSNSLAQAAKAFNLAEQFAGRAHENHLQARICSQSAYLFLLDGNSPSSMVSAQRLLAQANSLSPMEPETNAVAATMLFKVGQSTNGEKILDQALMLDPANWLALWTKYKELTDAGKAADKNLIVAQLNRYYPNVPEVLALTKTGTTSQATKNAQKPKKKP